jgi:hypothetical protein
MQISNFLLLNSCSFNSQKGNDDDEVFLQEFVLKFVLEYFEYHRKCVKFPIIICEDTVYMAPKV